MTTQAEATIRTFKCTNIDNGENSRNIVVCIDGTSNQFGTKNTNIVELYSHIVKNDMQLTYYSSGLGAFAKIAGASLGHRVSNEVDMAFGRNLHTVIMATYRWLSETYRDGDKIYLFGFSRGAYQVRALAGMIARVGLLLPGNNEQIPFAFELYSKTDDDEPSMTRPADAIGLPTETGVLSNSSQTRGLSKKKSTYTELAETFKKTFCRKNVHIHFVGVWDTVSSVGFGRGKTLPCTTSSCEHICYFRHALALDERRVKFLPEYVFGGRSDSTDDDRIKEVWFAGAHSDVGGGNRRNAMLQSGDIPLLWMRSQAMAAGLQLEPADVMWKIDDLEKEITPSLNLGWWLLELLPLRRLLYCNSDKKTSLPHLGGPRRILPGQKVHVSALFKNNYKPYAKFHGSSEKWPDPMFWNDPNSHLRLQNLSDSWEKDVFDDCSIQTLLADLVQPPVRGQANLDVLDRLAFMANFDVCKHAINAVTGSEETLAAFLRNSNKLVRLSAAVTYCELGWNWPPAMHHSLSDNITGDIAGMLESRDSRENRRACVSLPSLCKQKDLRTRLVNDKNLRIIIRLCDSARMAKHEEGSTVAFHSAQALSMVMKSDSDLAPTLMKIGAITDIIQALHDKSNPVVVSVLSIIDGLAKHGDARASMKNARIIPTLLKLMKQFDDFVAPAAIRVLCSLLKEADLRKTMLHFGVLSTFVDMLNQCSDDTKQVVSDALVEFAKHADVRQALSNDGHLHKLATWAQSRITHRRDGAVTGLVALGAEDQIREAVKDAIKDARTVEILITRLDQKSNALFAASALVDLVKIDNVALMVVAEGLNAPAHIINMLRRRWFDGTHGEDGINVLCRLLECGRLRSTILQSGAVDVLRGMLEHRNGDTVYAGLHYLRAIARFEDGKRALCDDDELVRPILGALRTPRQKVQRIVIETLRVLFEGKLRAPILEGLLGLLKSRRASDVFASSTTLRLLAPDKLVCDEVVKNGAFWELSNEYYNVLNLVYDKKGPKFGEVYESVGLMIKSMQGVEGSRKSSDKWLEPAPYEL